MEEVEELVGECTDSAGMVSELVDPGYDLEEDLLVCEAIEGD